MSEKSSVMTVRKHMTQAGAHFQRIEDAYQPGVPDVNMCLPGHGDAWIEFKQMDEEDLPKRATTPVKIGLKPEQALWLRTRKNAGGRAVVCAKVHRTWYVFRDYFEELLKGVLFEELAWMSAWCWTGNFSVNDFIKGVYLD